MGEEITRIAVFDFDGTLINTALPDEGRIAYKEKTGQEWPHKGWWGRAETLDLNIFDMPVIKSTIDLYNQEKQSDSTLMVMLTGRLFKLSNEVKKVLNHNGLEFDEYLFNTGGDTLHSKIGHLNDLLNKYPNAETLIMSDDRLEHIPHFHTWCKSKIDDGTLKSCKINVVESNNHTK